ncbi:MAG TPA: RNA-binding protein [Candidatus Acidoferrales bacterium]|nr:RNA-binding protein [Candidatus Acidoferrales bacterium]
MHGHHGRPNHRIVDLSSAIDQATSDRSERRAVFVSGIPARTPEEEVREHFEKCGTVIDLKLWPDRKRLAWYAVVTFQDEADARRAISSPAPIKGVALTMAFTR